MDMHRISIDFVSRNDIRIYIDDEKLENVAGFLLEIQEGKEPKCSIDRNIFPKKDLEGIDTQKKWRTVKGAVDTLRAEDSETAITETLIKDLIKKGEISVYKNGVKYMVDLEEIKRHLNKSSVAKKQGAKIKAVPL